MLRRMALADEVASAAAFLASDEASYITGPLPGCGWWIDRLVKLMKVLLIDPLDTAEKRCLGRATLGSDRRPWVREGKIPTSAGVVTSSVR